jgi:hypothetical protein
MPVILDATPNQDDHQSDEEDDASVGEGEPAAEASRPKDPEELSPMLKALLGRAPDPLVELMLRGGSSVGCDDGEVFRVVVALQHLMKTCASKGHTGDAEAVQSALDTIRAEHRTRNGNQETCVSHLGRDKIWAEKLGEIDGEERLALSQADDKFRLHAAELEAEWTNERRPAQYAKPSAALVAMRRTAQRMAAANKDLSVISKQIAGREAEESRAAKLSEGYRAALAQLRGEQEAGKVATRRRFHGMRAVLIKKKELHIGPIQNRVKRTATPAVPVQAAAAPFGKAKVIRRPLVASGRRSGW